MFLFYHAVELSKKILRRAKKSTCGFMFNSFQPESENNKSMKPKVIQYA